MGKQRSVFLHSFLSCQRSWSSRNRGFSVVRAPCPLDLGFCDVRLLHPGKLGGPRGSVVTVGRATKEDCCAWTMAESLLCSVLRQLQCSYVDQVIQEFAFDVSDVLCPGFLIHPTLRHGQWVICLFSGEADELIEWAHDDIGLLLYFCAVRFCHGPSLSVTQGTLASNFLFLRTSTPS